MHIPELDRWISAEFQRLAEIIRDYDSHLELRWIPPENRTDPHDRSKPYCIWDTRSNYVVMFASELDSPREILAKLWSIDNRNGSVLDKIQATNDAAAAFELKEHMDQIEEASDLAAFAVQNEKSRWKHNGIWLDDEMRRI